MNLFLDLHLNFVSPSCSFSAGTSCAQSCSILDDPNIINIILVCDTYMMALVNNHIFKILILKIILKLLILQLLI